MSAEYIFAALSLRWKAFKSAPRTPVRNSSASVSMSRARRGRSASPANDAMADSPSNGINSHRPLVFEAVILCSPVGPHPVNEAARYDTLLPSLLFPGSVDVPRFQESPCARFPSGCYELLGR